jgi:hypothetical protein
LLAGLAATLLVAWLEVRLFALAGDFDFDFDFDLALTLDLAPVFALAEAERLALLFLAGAFLVNFRADGLAGFLVFDFFLVAMVISPEWSNESNQLDMG